MGLPNFLIIGAQKAGTTALYHHLKQHDQVFMSPVKEPKFFALEGDALDFRGPRDRETITRSSITNLSEYKALFNSVTNEVAIGEASTWYLYIPEAPERIHKYIPDAKLIAILRNPVERAFSAYMHLIRDGREPIKDFAQALQKETERIRDHWTPLWYYKDVGFYYQQLNRYFKSFRREQLQIHLYEDFTRNPIQTLQSIAQFLEISPFTDINTNEKHNVSGIPKFRHIDDLISKPHFIKEIFKIILPTRFRQNFKRKLRNQLLFKPMLPDDAKRLLMTDYREDILQLQDLIQKDLSAWLE